MRCGCGPCWRDRAVQRIPDGENLIAFAVGTGPTFRNGKTSAITVGNVSGDTKYTLLKSRESLHKAPSGGTPSKELGEHDQLAGTPRRDRA